jgi:hypothetical protein
MIVQLITIEILMNKTNKDKLKSLEIEQLTSKYPSMRPELIPLTDWKDNSANSLTKSIIFWINSNGGQAERISSQGQYREGKKIAVGESFKQLPGKWTPGQSTKGTADISATIRGRSVKIEVKYGRDVQSEVQKQYQEMIEKAGGTYIIARDFDSFVTWYENFLLYL